MPRVIEDVQEFIQRHGGRTIQLGESEQLLCPDGARTSLDGTVRMEPPPDGPDLLRLKRRYLVADHERALDQFEKTKTALVQQTQYAVGSSNVIPPTAADVKFLEHLRDQTTAAQQRLEQFDADHTHSDEARRRRDEAKAARAAELRSLMQELNQVQL